MFLGLVRALVDREIPFESELPFDQARDNFYTAARLGLDADVVWQDGKVHE